MARGGFHDSLINSEGQFINGATVEVFNVDTGTPATIYQTDGVTSISGGTFLTGYRDGLGEIVFTADNGQYDIKITDGTAVTWIENQTILNGSSLISTTDLATTTTPGIVEEATPSEMSAGTASKFPAADTIKGYIDGLGYSNIQRVVVNFSTDANYTLSSTENTYFQIEMTDTGVVLTAAREVIIASSNKIFSFINSTAQTLTVKTSGGAGVTIHANGLKYNLYCDATNVYPSTDGSQLQVPIATTSGTSVSYTGIPSGIKKVTIHLMGVSTNGVSGLAIQIGPSGGVETTGYVSSCNNFSTSAVGGTTDTTQFVITGSLSASTEAMSGHVTLMLSDPSTNTWTQSGTIGRTIGAISGGYKAIAGALSQLSIKSLNGTDTFDAGSVNISYE